MDGPKRIPFLLAAFFLPQNRESVTDRPPRSKTARRCLQRRRAPRVFQQSPFCAAKTRERLQPERRQRLQDRRRHRPRRLG